MSAAVGSVEWERAGGPALSIGEKLSLLAGAGALVATDTGARLRWWLNRWGPLGHRMPAKVDLAAWAPPDTRAAKEAERFLKEVSSAPMVLHSVRTYYFAALLGELTGQASAVDREALYVSALLHDVGLFEEPRPAGEHCFTVGGARAARKIAKEAGWEAPRADRVAVAITTNLNPSVPAGQFGLEAHLMSIGGRVEVLAQEWKVHPENLAEVLGRAPRDGFVEDSLAHVKREGQLNPGGRFACLDPLFPIMVRRGKFSIETALARR